MAEGVGAQSGEPFGGQIEQKNMLATVLLKRVHEGHETSHGQQIIVEAATNVLKEVGFTSCDAELTAGEILFVVDGAQKAMEGSLAAGRSESRKKRVD